MADRIGQILVEMGVLTDWQVEAILQHQRLSRQRFGQIAVARGWARPEDIWQAWARQLADEQRTVDLDAIGVDTAALERVPPGVARHYQVIALRAWGDNLVLAVAADRCRQARGDLPGLLAERLFFCLAAPEQIARSLDKACASAIS